MEQGISEQELFRSCEILFGTDLDISREFLDYLQAGGIKSAYRKRALETHPDRLIGFGLPLDRQGVERFHAVREAYENLLCFLQDKETGRRKCAATVRQHPAPPRHSAKNSDRQHFFHAKKIKPITLPGELHRTTVSPNTERFYQGPLPRRHLLFGHFLYYSGLTNWRTIARVLTWQRTERPRLGELGRRFGMCGQEDVNTILRTKRSFGHFGETARMLGILTEHQVRVLMFHQQRLQKKFGTILLEKKLIGQPELQELLNRFERHNATLRA